MGLRRSFVGTLPAFVEYLLNNKKWSHCKIDLVTAKWNTNEKTFASQNLLHRSHLRHVPTRQVRVEVRVVHEHIAERGEVAKSGHMVSWSDEERER